MYGERGSGNAFLEPASCRCSRRAHAATTRGKVTDFTNQVNRKNPPGLPPRPSRNAEAIVPQCSATRSLFSSSTDPSPHRRGRGRQSLSGRGLQVAEREGIWKKSHISSCDSRRQFVQRKKARSRRTWTREKVRGGGSRQGRQRSAKNLRMCRVMTLLRTRIDSGAPQRRFLDPTDAPRSGGWACKPRPRYWLPAGTPSVRQKQRPITNTAEVCVLLALHTRALYHDLARHSQEPAEQVAGRPPAAYNVRRTDGENRHEET